MQFVGDADRDEFAAGAGARVGPSGQWIPAPAAGSSAFAASGFVREADLLPGHARMWSEYDPVPPPELRGPAKRSVPKKAGTLPCKFFASGHCKYESNCYFQHDRKAQIEAEFKVDKSSAAKARLSAAATPFVPAASDDSEPGSSQDALVAADSVEPDARPQAAAPAGAKPASKTVSPQSGSPELPARALFGGTSATGAGPATFSFTGSQQESAKAPSSKSKAETKFVPADHPTAFADEQALLQLHFQQQQQLLQQQGLLPLGILPQAAALRITDDVPTAGSSGLESLLSTSLAPRSFLGKGGALPAAAGAGASVSSGVGAGASTLSAGAAGPAGSDSSASPGAPLYAVPLSYSPQHPPRAVVVGESLLVDGSRTGDGTPYRGSCRLCNRQFNSRSQEQAHIDGKVHRNRAARETLNQLVSQTPLERGACFNCHQTGHVQTMCPYICRAYANGGRWGCRFGNACRMRHVEMA